MHKPHIFFTDLDGTLLNSQGVVSPATRTAIERYLAAGNRFVIASGRSLSSINGVIRRAGIPSENLLIISYNGSYVYDTKTQKALLEYRIPFDIIRHLMDASNQAGLHFQTYTDEAVVCQRRDPEVDAYVKSTQIPAIYAEDLIGALDREPLKAITISLDHHDALLALRDTLAPWMAGKLEAVFSCDAYLEFIDYRSGKGNAVQNVCRLLNLPVQDAYAAGDAANDLSMLEAAGHSIAMANATEEVKRSASMITKADHDHDGLAEILLSLI